MEETIIKINEVEYKIKKSTRALLLFEELTGKSVYEVSENLTNLTKLFYCYVKACNRDIFKFTLDEFIDLIDDSADSIEIFNKYLIESAEKETPGNPKKKKA